MTYVQITADVANTKQHRRSSSRNKAAGLVRLFPFEVTRSFGSVRSKRRVKEECNMKRVGENEAEIHQLHMRNSLFYLRYKPEVQAAGEPDFDAVRSLVAFD